MSRISSPYSLSSSSRPQSTTTINNNLNGQNIVMEEDLLQDETLYFERNRIKQLKDERRDIQKKTFTKWCNTYLSRARMEVQDLFADLGDGIMLLKFLEIISGESLGKPNRGRMRVQKIENINKSLEFLKQKKIQLENIGAEDIADGNEHLILGLIWTIILRFTIENIEIEAKESGERKHAKEALLLWCQRKTAGYPNVRIDNFSSSWRSGLAFCALIHAHHPELINFDGLNTQDPLSNLNMAFDVAERKLDIARLLDAEDVNVSCPDEKSIITYVSLFYHCFAKEKSELTGARRVAKVVGELVQLDSLQEDYEQLSADLLCWIHQKIKELADRHFPNLLIALRELLVTFSRFRKEEKPPKYKEKGELEALFFAIQTKRNAGRRKPYIPPEGLGLHDLESAWTELEKAEHSRQGALIGELQRQERLELRAQLFHKKADVRDAWLREMQSVLNQFECQQSAQTVEAGLRLLRNISAESIPKTSRFALLSELSIELQREHFHDFENIRTRAENILSRWNTFLAILAQRESELGRLGELSTLLGELEELGEELTQLGQELVRQRTQENCKHLAAVDELLRRLELTENNIRAKKEWLIQLSKRARQFAKSVSSNNGQNGTEQLFECLNEREKQLNYLQSELKQHRNALQRAKEFFQFIAHWEEQRGWLADRLSLCRFLSNTRDLSNISQSQRAHKSLEAEMAGQWERTKLLIGDGERLNQSEEVHGRLEILQKQWEELRVANIALLAWIREADRLQQYFQDANETESWIRERMPLTQSEDFGRDISTSECLWRRHRQLEKEIFNYETEIQRLNILSNELTQTKFILDENIVDGGLPDIEEENNKNMEEEEEEEIVVPKVVALYAYNGNNKNKNEIISVNRGEELALLDTSNKDWWRVLTRTGIEGYLPSNYCELIKNETVEIMQPKIIKKLNKRKEGIISLDGPSAIEKRQNKLNSDYQNLTSLSQKRGKALEEATNLFKFFAECTDFEQWAKITGQNLQEPLNQEHLPALQKKFRKVRDEINNQGQTQFSQLIKMSEQFIQCNNTNSYSYSRVGEILKRKEKIIYLWSQLQSLLNKKSAKLEFAQNLWNFNEKCADTKEWLEEKREQMQRQPPPSKIIGNGTTTHSSHDLKALQAAQRRLQNMERDLRPLADRMNTLWTQAKQISEEQPERAEEVQTKVQSLEAMHAELLAQARAWIEQSERSQGQQMFEQAASELLGWTQKCSQQMDLSPSSLPSASEEALRRNAELREQIDGKQFEFGYVEELGQRLIQKGHPKEQVKQRLEELEDAKNELECQWQKREADCRRLLEMQAFTREADRINSLNRGQLAFLDLSSSQADSVEKVQNLLKGQAEFEAKLSAQEERVLSFVASADRLIRTGHSQSTQIENQKREVLYGHQGVIERTQMRRSQLERGLALEGLRRDASELGHWISEKRRQMEQQNEVGGLNWAQTRHQAFMLELPANRAELSRLAKSGATLIRDGIAEREAVANVLEPLEVEWTKLEKLARQRSDLLQQEEQKVSLLEAINEINGKIEEIGNRLSNKTKGKDLRGVKQLINKNVQTGQEIQLLEDRLNEISKKANKMNEKKHSAAPEILERVEVLNVRFNSLHGPLEKMREELEESMGWHQLAFDADVELQWIGEKQLLVECPQLGHSLTEVQQLVKRHEQLTAELDCHQPLVTELLNKGRKLANFDGINGHSCRKEIDAKCLELSNSWTKLMELSAKRRKLLNRTLSREQLLFELSEAENWLSEKNKQLETREEEAISEGHGGAQALFAWLRTFQNELGPFQTSLAELRNKCINLKELGINEEQITERELQIKAQANALEEHARLSAEHADALLNIHNLEEEQQELEQWLEQKSKILSQDDCGGDLEQWEKIQAKFNDERQQIRALGYERLQRLENEANILSKKAPEHAREVLKGQNRLHALWELINEYIEQRESSLAQAEILYRFLRDAEELEERLREKEMTLPNDLGRDAKQSYVLILKHEVFENELAQLREEIEALVASGSQFEQLEENIKLRPLVDSWTRLQEASLHRGEQLMATYETHKFISQVRDLLQWTQSALVEMGGEQTIRDLQTAEWLAEEHRRLRAELEGREQERSLLVNIGRELERAGHCPVEVVHQRLAGLDQAFASVRKEWALKADWLEQAVQWHAFQREAIQILAQIQARDRSLDALEQQREFDKQSKEDKKEKSPAHRKKELNTLVRVLATLEERISRLGEMAETLEEQGHAETEQIQALTRRVMNALNELGEHANSVKRSLDAAEELTQFEAELADLTDWLIEKEESFRTQQATSFISSNDSGQLTNKLERLKRQQALQSELAANTPRLEKLRAHKEKIRNRQRGADVKQALTHCDEFFQRWDQLLAQSKALDAALEEARDLLELEQLADRFGTFLRDKEALVQAEELGGDLEHCQTLINRLKEAHKGVDEKTLIEANILAKKRMINSKGGNSESSHILARLNDINEGWERLSGRIQTYQALLEAALEVHRFNRDVDETNQRIGEKTSILSAEQQAKDLAGVERLLRAQDQAERDMSAIHRKLNEHDEQAKLLLAQEPPLRETVLDSLRKLELSWQRLAELAHARRQALQQAYSLHHFLDLVRRTDQWAQLIRAKMSGQAPSRNVAEAERALQRHAERIAEIGARDDEFRALRELGQRLLQEQPEHRSDLQRAQRRLQTLEHQTRQYWEREQQTLEQSLLFQKILSQIGQIDCWLAGKQAQLDGLTAGESPESAEVAIRELGHFIVALEPQLAERFSWFDSTNKTLDSLTNDYPEGNRVKERVDEIKEKCIELQKQTETKQRNLNANKHLAKFLRECAELITWMNAKLQLAMDDGYLDATALRLKLKKHLAFDAELRASQERVDRLQKRGQYLLNEEFGKDSTEDKEESEERVRAQIQELNNGWNELLAKSAEKTDRLRNAHEAHQLERRIVESECWLERVEAIICSEDHGTDCSSAEQLLEQFEILRTEIRAKGSLIEELCEEASKLVEKTGEDLGTNRQLLCERAEALQARWNAIEEPCQIRAENLSEAVSFYHWADQTDEQLEWLEARVRSLESSDYGRSLHSAQSLLQKHQILEKEFGVRQPAFSQLITTGEKMLLVEMKNNNSNKDNKKEKKQKGPKSDELTERLDKLHDLITLFRALASVREQRLNESLLSQEFYAEAAEAEHWMKERLIPSTNHQQFSHQQESGRQAEAQLRRCLALEKEILTFEDQLKKLGEKCERMVSADHFDLTGLQTRHVQLQELFFQLSSQCHQRKTQTTNAIRYFGFVRRADELLQWLRERLALAEREDYGQDLEECELLAQQFHEVVRELASAGERVAQILTLKEELLREKHPNAGSIRAKGQDVQQLWHEVNEAANERQQALMDGKNIHLFDQKADELLERLAEKEAHLLALSEEQCGGIDLDQMIGQRERLNNEFMLSLNVLSRQVLELCAEADHIVELFPRTSEHLEVRRGELIEQLKDVREGADRQTERLAQSQVNHQYFQEFRELMIWARQMHATITGELLPKEVAGCEALSARHAEFRREISSKEAEKLKITQKGDQMLAQGHNALINEIRSRITTLEEVFTDLLRTWHRRQQIYEDNADLQRWLSSASELERWLTEREQLLAQDWTGLVQDGLEAVEHQIRQFDDFLATLDAQSPQFEALKRLTRLEQNWERLKGQEDRERIAAVNARLQQQQQNRRETQPIRTLEKKKMLQEKRQERERRKTQEISLMGNSAGGIGRQSATGHSIRSSTSAHSGAHMLGQIQQLEPVQSMSTTAFNNSSQTLPRARQRAAGGATSSASSSTSVVVVEGQQTIVPPVSSSRLSIEISQPSSTQQQQNSTPSAPFPVGMRVPPTGRTPGFTTRRTQSIRRSRQWDDLRTVDIHGYLDRKQELQAGGKRATFRSWKSYYSILCGQLLCFFKDEQHFMENMAASAPLALHGSNSALNPEYIKKRFVFKLNTADGAEFLFAAPDQLKALEWVDKINFRAKLDPADQLLAFRPSTSEPLGNPQSRRLPYSSTAADIMSNSRSTTLEPRPKPRELGGNVVNTFKLPNESQKMIKSATLDPRRIGDDKHNYYSSTNQKNEGIEQKIENQQFASQIKIGEEVEEEEKIIVEEEDLENSPNNNCRNNQNGSSHIFEDTISVRSGMGGTIKSKKITSGAFAFLRRSSAVIGGKKSACENSLDLN